MSSHHLADSTHLDPATRETWRREIARLPLTMQPALNQQVNAWDDLFPFEQRRAAEFLNSISAFQPAVLDELTRPLREIEEKMNIAHSGFSLVSDTMTNASMLARSPYYPEWRNEVQKVFSAIESKARKSAQPESVTSRLVVLILPESLPITSISGKKSWEPRGVEYRIDGDPHRIIELALQANSGLPALLGAQPSRDVDAASANTWLIDADAHLGTLVPSTDAPPASLLQFAVLKQFKDQFLAQVNTVPKDIQGTDQILARMRRQDWDPWWPTSLAGQNRLRSFVVELFLSGNGALIFSNAFVQWCASEVIRRARPRLVVARFGVRSKPKPFTGIAIFENQQKISSLQDAPDPEGSAIDALILARYVWLSALRYPEAQQTSCICIGEASRTAYILAPVPKRPAWEKDRAIKPEEIHDWMRASLA